MNQPAGPPDDGLVAALTAGAEDRPESRVLDHLIGDWRVTTDWEPVVGQGVRRGETRMESRWIFDGRAVESRSYDPDGAECARLYLAFDLRAGDYTAYAVTRLSTHFELERGAYDADARSLVFLATEAMGDGRPGVRYQRTVHLRGVDVYTTSLSYPDVPPGTYGPMFSTHERIG